ncbi:MAG TPA: glycosyl hydrolase [Chloroflexota bacterium]|nr:glycosyl hydrolase [Chloroflexota bacterium]
MRRLRTLIAVLLLGLLGAGGEAPAVLSTPAAQPASPLDRYGVWITATDPTLGPLETARRVLDQLGLRWYATFDHDADTVPPGANKVMALSTRTLASEASLREAAQKRPGSYWLIGREPNVPGGDPQGPLQYAEALRYYSRILKEADPTAKLVGPNVLNWDLTCQACPGFDPGRQWTEAFRAAYQQLTGDEPPFDAWGIQTADLNWEQLPMVNWRPLGDQLVALREYLDRIPAQRGKPIWVTEFAIVWGYERVEWSQQPDGTWRAYPAGQYRADLVAEALAGFLGWLEAHAEALGIERWLVYGTYPPPDPFMAEYAGMRLLSAPAGEASRAGSVVREASSRIRTAGPLGRPLFAVAPVFRPFYDRHDGLRILGRPLSPLTTLNGLPVQYFEKGRLEDHSSGATDPAWQIQYGLLVDELQQAQADVPVGGDVSAVTYARLARLAAESQRLPPPPGFTGGVAQLSDGSVFIPFSDDLSPAPGHYVPRQFWEYMNNADWFPGGWLHDIGLPITEALRIEVVKQGIGPRTVQVQAFQRTVLTYDPANPPEWQVERANVGTDYARAFPQRVPLQ